jgi:hypothetical protein
MAQTVAGLTPRRSGFMPGSVRVGFVVALGHVFHQVLWFSPVSIIIPSGLHTYISSYGGRTVGPLVAAVQRHSLTPSKNRHHSIKVYVGGGGGGRC